MMKQKIKSIMVSLLLVVCLVGTLGIDALAQDSEKDLLLGKCIDGSYLTDEESSEVTVESLTKGIYLQSGSATVVRKGVGYLAAGGSTIARKTVGKITVVVRVERLVNGVWKTYTSWSATRENAMSVYTSKSMSVPTGYYYRTCCSHYAASDTAISYSDGIWV